MIQRSRMNRVSRMLAAPLVAALVVAACGGGGDDDASDEANEQADDDASDDDSDDTSDDDSDDTSDDDASDGDSSDDGGTLETLPPDNTDSDPVPGGTLTYAIEAELDGLNPTSSQLTASAGLMISSAVFDTLAVIDTEGNPVPYLAESFTPNDDFSSWDVKVREGVLFHDGTPLNADALIANFQAQYNNPLVGLAVRPFYPEENQVEKIDDLTVRYNLTRSNTRFPSYLSSQLGMVSSPTWLEAALEDPTLNQAPVGTGPFKFDSREVDSITRFVRNDDWWNGSAYLDAVEFRIVTDPATRVDLLASGEVQALHASDPATTLRLQDMESDGVRLILDDTGAERFVMMNAGSPPFDDIRARQALTFATPKQNVLALIGGGVWRSADSRFTPESPYHNPDVVQEADMPELAAPLVEAYCADVPDQCTDGKINMEYQDSGPSTVQDNLKDILVAGWSEYFNVEHDRQFQDKHIEHTITGLYGANTWRQFSAPDPVTDNVWVLCETIGGLSLNFPRYCDEERDAKLLDAQAATEDAERFALVQEAEALMNESYTYIFLAHELWTAAFADGVRGVCDRTTPEGVKPICFAQGQTWHDSIWIEQ